MYSSVPFSLKNSRSFMTNFSPLPKKYYVLGKQKETKQPEPVKIEEPVMEEVIIDEPKPETKPKRKAKK